MKWKNRLTNYNFWISIVSAVLLILQAFNINFDIAYINEIATAVLGLLVVIGIISDPTKAVEASTKKQIEETKTEEINEIKAEENAQLTEEKTIPSADEVETPACNNENDFQTIVNLISKEIEKLTEELRINNLELTKKMNETFKNEEQIISVLPENQLTIENVQQETNLVETNLPKNEEPTQYNIVN